MKSKTILILLLVLIFSMLIPTQIMGYEEVLEDSLIEEDYYEYGEYDIVYMRGEVLEIFEITEGQGTAFSYTEQKAVVKILSGEFKGQELDVENVLMDHPLYDIVLEEGNQYYFAAEMQDGELIRLNVGDYIRDRYNYILILLFILVILLVGKLKGLKALVTLALTILLIIRFYLPMIVEGHNPIILAIILAACVTLLTLLIIGGFNRKTYAAITGTVGGVLVAGTLALLVGELTQLTGFSSEEAQMLQFADTKIENIRGILFAGIIIGSLGAVMDVAMSVASACAEIVNVREKISVKQLFQSGMNVGKDIMGTMSNTLILAYTGTAIPLMLLFYIYETPYDRIINMDMISTEIVRALTGSIGLIITIPLTAFVAAVLLKKE